jgi:hypothetical protein
MLGKIWGFRRGDYEECLLLGCKSPVRTSEEEHFVSATEPSRLILRKVWGVHEGDYEECLLKCYAVWVLQENTALTCQKTALLMSIVYISVNIKTEHLLSKGFEIFMSVIRMKAEP